MSGIRVSNIWAMEDEYGKGRGNNSWIAPPPGSYISLSFARSTSEVYTPGCKTFDTVAYGAISGSWNWSFNLDYDYMEPLLLAFEGYAAPEGSNPDGTYTHVLSKSNNKRVPSFSIRRKQLNVMAGGPEDSDEVTDVLGCVCKSIKFSMQAGSSQISVAMSGSFADLKTYNGSLPTTDYQEYNGDLAEFSCMYIGDAKCENYVANVDSMSIGVDNSSGTIMSTCVPVSKGYNEGISNYTFSASCYSNNPELFKRRAFSGGYSAQYLRPKYKNMKPLDKISVASYNKSVEDDGCTCQEAIDTATRSVMFTMTGCILKSVEWQRGDDAKIMDQMSSTKCKGMYITIKNGVADLRSTDRNKVVSSPDTF